MVFVPRDPSELSALTRRVRLAQGADTYLQAFIHGVSMFRDDIEEGTGVTV